MIEFRKDTATTNLIRKTLVDVDTGDAQTRAYIKRIADSVAANRTTNDYTIVRFYGVLGTNASDSANLTIGVNGVYEGFNPNFDMYAFNFSLLSTQPSFFISTFRTDRPDYPMKAADSIYIFRLSRNATIADTSKQVALSIYKVSANAGPDINDRTAGTFYDMAYITRYKMTNAANRFFTVDVAFRRKP